MDPTYPFTPKSSRKLNPGDFWSIPLANGRFACGRVVEHMPKGMPGAGVGFLGGVLDWTSSLPPTSESIAGAEFLEQGVMHIKAILETGGCVLGNRSLASDGLSAFTFIHGATIQKGFTPVRKWRKQDNENLPTFSWWGYDVAQIIANKHFAESVAKSDSEI